jgi:hypothetical protein
VEQEQPQLYQEVLAVLGCQVVLQVHLFNELAVVVVVIQPQ